MYLLLIENNYKFRKRRFVIISSLKKVLKDENYDAAKYIAHVDF